MDPDTKAADIESMIRALEEDIAGLEELTGVPETREWIKDAQDSITELRKEGRGSPYETVLDRYVTGAKRLREIVTNIDE